MTATPTPEDLPTSCDQTGDEIFGSLTRFDEILIEKAFGKPIYELAADKFALARAMVLVVYKRQGLADKLAVDATFKLGLGAVLEFFADEPDDVDPDAPDSPAGKDRPQLDELHETKPSGA